MKVIGIISSPRRNGNTAALVREALKGAAENGAEVTEVFLPDYRIEYCKGCMQCTAAGKCGIPDDLEALRKLLYEANGVILGSPTYGFAMNAIMKNFTERLGMFTFFSSAMGGKYLAGISTAGSTVAKKVAKSLANLLSNGIFQRGYISGSLGVGVRAGKAEDDPAAMNQARRLGRKIAEDIKAGRKYPFQNLPTRLVMSLIMKGNFRKVVLMQKDGGMKAVYASLSQRGLI